MRRTTELGAGLLAVAGLVLLAACGDASESVTDPSSAAGARSTAGASDQVKTAQDDSVRQQKAENAIADCMKQKGFSYVPNKSSFDAREAQFNYLQSQFVDRTSLLQPDAVVRPLRQKYGFGVAAKDVYPDDPAVVVPKVAEGATEDPNAAIRKGLDGATRQAYDQALGTETKGDAKGVVGCAQKAYEKFLGTTDVNRKHSEDQKVWNAFSSAPQVVQAAKKYGDCLHNKGYRITSTKPGDVEKFMLNLVRPIGIAGIGSGNDQPGASAGAGAANEALTAEIAKAMDDLDCRGSYAEIVRTKYPQVVGIDLNSAG
jgi:hypothetical protein